MKKPDQPVPEYGMFSVDGNEAVNNLINGLQLQFWEGLKSIKASHPEVMHENVTEKINAALKKFYYANPMELTILKPESKIGDYVHYREEVKGILTDKSEDGLEATIKLPDGNLKTVKI